MGSSHSKNATFDVQALKTRRVAFEQPSVVASCAKTFAMPCEVANLKHLGPDVWAKLFTFLPVRDLPFSVCQAWLKVLLSRDDIWRFFFMKLRDRGFEESAIPHHCLGAVQQLCFPLPASTAGYFMPVLEKDDKGPIMIASYLTRVKCFVYRLDGFGKLCLMETVDPELIPKARTTGYVQTLRNGFMEVEFVTDANAHPGPEVGVIVADLQSLDTIAQLEAARCLIEKDERPRLPLVLIG